MLRRYLDLLIIDIVTLFLVMIILSIPTLPFLRVVPGLLSILFFPGYVLVSVIFPGRHELKAAVRTAFSLGLSIVVSVLIGLLLGVTPWGFTLNSISIAMLLFILVTSGMAWRRRKRKISGDDSTKTPPFFTAAAQSFKTGGTGYRSLVIFLCLLIITGLSSLGYFMFRQLPTQPFTEFYILGESGKAEGYPYQLLPGQEGKVIIGIISHETEQTEYRVRLLTGGVQLNERAGIVLTPGEKWQSEMRFFLTDAGENQKVEFLLDKGREVPYETTYLWIDVLK